MTKKNIKALDAYENAKSHNMEMDICFNGRWYHVDYSDREGYAWLCHEENEPGAALDTCKIFDPDIYYFRDFDDLERNCKIQGHPFLEVVQNCEQFYC